MRLVRTHSGEVKFGLRFQPTFDYARGQQTLAVRPEGAIARGGTTTSPLNDYLSLSCQGVRLENDGAGCLVGRLMTRSGDRHWVVITESHDPDSARLALSPLSWEEALARTWEYWEHWATACTYQGPYRDQVLRNALVLKTLVYEPTGAIVAAPTTSLPEEVGGLRNWDYRYSWLRDASLVLYALITVGYQDEADEFLHWLHGAQRSDPKAPPHVMYTVGGRSRIPEHSLDHLEGYRCSRPVRIGNAAAAQFQMDVCGEVLRAAYLHYHGAQQRGHGTGTEAGNTGHIAAETWLLLRSLVEYAARHWEEPDNGIWERRGDLKPFLHSRLMCWAALDRGIRLARECRLPAPVARWATTRGEIRQAILGRGFDDGQGAFTQAFGVRPWIPARSSSHLRAFYPPRTLGCVQRCG